MTTIEWTDETWNPVTGCTKVSQGCKNCYAERLWPRIVGSQTKRQGDGFKGLRGMARPFTDVRTHPERLEAPLRWKKPRRIFVNSMSDLFHEDVPDEFILQVFDVMRECANGWTSRIGGDKGKLVACHTFQILTKRPARMLDFCTRLRFAQNDGRGLYLAASLPHNGFNPMSALKHVWLGVSVEDQATADERIPLLLQTPAAVRFISAEPLLGPIDLAATSLWTDMNGNIVPQSSRSPRLDWVITGGESGQKARPSHPDWFRSLRDQCAAAGVAYFFKQWGEWAVADLGNVDAAREDYFIAPDGTDESDRPIDQYSKGCEHMVRLGKKAAGRTLDGRTHDDYPEAKP